MHKLFVHANVVLPPFKKLLGHNSNSLQMSSFLHFTEAIWTRALACKCHLFFTLQKLFGQGHSLANVVFSTFYRSYFDRSNPLAFIVVSTFYKSCRIHPLANIVFSTFYRSCLDITPTPWQILSFLHFTEAVWT
jgi:hypothetical protein